MPVRIVHTADIPPIHMPGRDLTWLVTPETLGVNQMSVAILRAPAGSAVRPMHGHKDIEEVIIILEGEGEAYVDGERASFKKGDAVLFPANSKHQIRNTGTTDLVTVCVFGAVTGTDSYIMTDQDAFA